MFTHKNKEMKIEINFNSQSAHSDAKLTYLLSKSLNGLFIVNLINGVIS